MLTFIFILVAVYNAILLAGLLTTIGLQAKIDSGKDYKEVLDSTLKIFFKNLCVGIPLITILCFFML